MDRLEEVVRDKWEHFCWRNETEAKMLQTIGELVKEIETLRLDNTYLQQRLQRELEK